MAQLVDDLTGRETKDFLSTSSSYQHLVKGTVQSATELSNAMVMWCTMTASWQTKLTWDPWPIKQPRLLYFDRRKKRNVESGAAKEKKLHKVRAN